MIIDDYEKRRARRERQFFDSQKMDKKMDKKTTVANIIGSFNS